MASIITRASKGAILTNAELDSNFVNLNNDIASRVPTTSYTGAEILTRLLLVDGAGSNLDSNFLEGLKHNPNLPATPDKTSIVSRDLNGDFTARHITATSFVGGLTGSASLFAGNDASYYTDIPARLGYSPANIISPSFSGTPTAPTALVETNNNQIATTQFVKMALAIIYPVGAVYVNRYSSANPSTIFGFGTWQRINGRTLVGVDETNALMDAPGDLFGQAASALPSHIHTATIGSGTSTIPFETRSGGTFAHYAGSYYHGSSGNTTPINDATVSVSIPAPVINPTGIDASNGNYQPSIAVYMWVRVA